MTMKQMEQKRRSLAVTGEAVGTGNSPQKTWQAWGKKVAWFAVAHLTAYFLVGSVFLLMTSRLPEGHRQALDFFAFYQPIGGLVLLSQLIRGAILGVVCVPLLGIMENKPKPWLLLTGLVWGVGIVGSVEPLPGSFEGMLYTTTSASEHLMALGGSLVQVLLMGGILFKTGIVERKNTSNTQKAAEQQKKNLGKPLAGKFLKQFTLLHVATYFLVGIIFYQISGYEEALATMEAFSLWRSLENLVMPLVIFLGQFLRGFILAVLLLPFYEYFFQKSGGWKGLFITLWGMTFLAAVNIAPWLVQDVWLGDSPLGELFIGPPEVTVQMLLFSLFLYAWHRRTISSPGFTIGRGVNPFKEASRVGK